MSENSVKSIRNTVIASVIAGIILLVIPEARDYSLSLIKWLWTIVVWCWDALSDSYSFPGWAWLIIFALALIGVINIYLSLKRDEEEPEFKKYTEDHLYNAKWRWTWLGNKITNLWCFCPTCDATLIYDDSSCHSYYSENQTHFLCENCNNKIVSTVKGGNRRYAVGAAEREIVRRIRTGEYNAH